MRRGSDVNGMVRRIAEVGTLSIASAWIRIPREQHDAEPERLFALNRCEP